MLTSPAGNTVVYLLGHLRGTRLRLGTPPLQEQNESARVQILLAARDASSPSAVAYLSSR